MTFLSELARLREAATKGPWYEAGCNTVHGGDHEEIAHPFNLDSTDGSLIVFLVNHAEAIEELVRAVEKIVTVDNRIEANKAFYDMTKALEKMNRSE